MLMSAATFILTCPPLQLPNPTADPRLGRSGCKEIDSNRIEGRRGR